jgi:hypothetical protein
LVELNPAFLTKFIDTVRRACALRRRDGRRRVIVGGVIRRQFGIDRLVIRLRGGICTVIRFGTRFSVRRLGVRFGFGVLLVGLFVRRLAVGFLSRWLTDRDPVIEPEHDDNDVRGFGGKNAFGGGGPIGRIALRLIFDQAGCVFRFSDHAHVGLFGIGVFKTIGEPVRHGVTEHKNVALRYSGTLIGRRRL